jgi:hypothetical protein
MTLSKWVKLESSSRSTSCSGLSVASLENMTESVQDGGRRFGFDMSRFFDDTDPAQLEAGTKNLVAEINASTPQDQLSIVLAGPIETVWMALDAADPEARKNVEYITHGEDSFNQTHAKEDHDATTTRT